MRRLLLSGCLLFLATTARAQSTKRVAQLQLGSAQILMDATDAGKVSILAVHNKLEARALIGLADARAWLDTALVITEANDPRRRGVKWTYEAAGPQVFLYREVSVEDESFILAVGMSPKVTLTLDRRQAREMLADVATAARVAREMAVTRGGPCSFGVAVSVVAVGGKRKAGGGSTAATGPRVRLTPADSAALWLDRVREQIELRLITVGGAAADAGTGVNFDVEADGAVGEVRPDRFASTALRELRDAVIYAGGWHAFKGVPSREPVEVRATLVPKCPR